MRAVLAGAPMALSRGGEEGSWPGTKPESCARCPAAAAAASVDAPFFAPASPTRIKSSTSSSGGAGTHLEQGFRHWSRMRRAHVVRRHSNGSQVAPGAVAAVVRIRAREREAWEDGPNARGPNTRAARAARALRLSHVRGSRLSDGAGASTRRKGGVRLAGGVPPGDHRSARSLGKGSRVAPRGTDAPWCAQMGSCDPWPSLKRSHFGTCERLRPLLGCAGMCLNSPVHGSNAAVAASCAGPGPPCLPGTGRRRATQRVSEPPARLELLHARCRVPTCPSHPKAPIEMLNMPSGHCGLTPCRRGACRAGWDAPRPL